MLRFEYRRGEYLFSWICKSENTRNGFKHTATLNISTTSDTFGKTSGATCYYINRTWECYKYQTVIIKTLDELLANIYGYNRTLFKLKHNFARMTPKRLEMLDAILRENTFYITLLDVKKIMKTYDGQKYAIMD